MTEQIFESVTETEGGESYVCVKRGVDYNVTIYVPKDMGNSDYVEVLKYIATGGKVTPYTEPVVDMDYRAKRQVEYTKISQEETFATATGDFLDAILDFLNTNFPEEVNAHPKLSYLLNEVTRIKTSIPKE